MNKRLLGKTGIEVSEISFGGVEIGIPYGVGVNNQIQMPDEVRAIELLQESLDNGINFFDTARLYGRSEEFIGKAFKGKRKSVVISTKCTHLRTDNNKQLPGGKELRRIIDNSLRESLSALETDYIDVYMLHNADLEILERQEIGETFCRYRAEGFARAIGVSTYTIEETRKAIEVGTWDVIQLPFNLMDQRQGRFFDLGRQRGTGIVIRSVLLRGILTDKGRNLHPELRSVEQHRTLYCELLGVGFSSLPDLGIKFALSFPEVSSVLVGIDQKEYLRKAIAAANGTYLDKKTLSKAIALAYPDPDFLDLPAWRRMGWIK